MVSKRRDRDEVAQRCLHSRHWLCTCAVSLFLIWGFPGEIWAVTADGAKVADAAAATQTEEKGAPSLDDILRSDFVYQRGSRPDPFVPFLREKTVTGRIETEEILTGMRLFEPGQLNLVAISTGGTNPFALVQDSTGKGYILKEGIAIGRRGAIVSIMPNNVIIEESFLSSAGQQKKRTIKMVLRKEGEK